MADATTVRLPRSHKALFPDSCVGCGSEHPRSGITIWTWSVGWWAILTLIALFWSKTARARAPACRRCAWALRFRRLASWAVVAAAIAVALALTEHWLPKAPRLIGRVAGVGICVVLLFPAALWSVTHPPALELTIEGEEVLYEFREVAYAWEFAELNGTLVGV